MDDELLLKLMIEMEYTSMINFKNSNKHANKLYKLYKNYIYKKRITNIHCIKDLQDAYLIIANIASIDEVCMKNQQYKNTIDCNDPDFTKKLKNMIDNHKIIDTFDVMRVVIKCFDTPQVSKVFWNQIFLKTIYNKIVTKQAAITDGNRLNKNVEKAWGIFYDEQLIHLKKKVWERLNSLYPCPDNDRSLENADCN